MVESISMMTSPIQSRCSSLGVVGILKDEGSDLVGPRHIFSGTDLVSSLVVFVHMYLNLSWMFNEPSYLDLALYVARYD